MMDHDVVKVVIVKTSWLKGVDEIRIAQAIFTFYRE